MIIYNPHNEKILKERVAEAKNLLEQIPVKYCFITGSFLYKKHYKDIDIFVITRSKKKLTVDNKKAKVTIIDFNDLYSLFYHSISKSCIAKNILPTKPLKVTLSDYWQVINEAVPTLLNQKNKYHKAVRFLVLYAEYFISGETLDTFNLNRKITLFKNYKEILTYIKENVPSTIIKKTKKTYVKRFLYTQAGHYKDLQEYEAHRFLYSLTHSITKASAHG